jgi:DNA (cytosine-5)-methyltransferase 1
MKILNLYAGIGGNRKLWNNVEVTAVEYNAEIAGIYKEYFPNDTVIVTDAHEYLLQHYREFDFIWSSPPCPSHSKIRMMGAKQGQYDAVFIDMKLWQEIIFLQTYAEGKYVIENVQPYYEPLVKPAIELERHCFWSNFNIKPFNLDKVDRKHNYIGHKAYGFDLSNRKIKHRKDQILRNLVNPELGLYIMEQAQGIMRKEKIQQQSLFE